MGVDSRDEVQRARLLLIALGVLALLGAIGGGLARLGWPLPATAGLVAFHGPLRVAGFIVLLIGLALTSVAPDPGVRLAGVAMVALAIWLGVFDIARRTVRTSGLTRFIAGILASRPRAESARAERTDPLTPYSRRETP